MCDLLRFEPLYQERVWGGRILETVFGRILPGERPVGESWEVVDRPEAQSVVVGGAWHGQTLRRVLAANAAEVMGPSWPVGQPFPILIKWLDCRERLSLQVHPPAGIAAALGGEPKTENWYIAETVPGAKLMVGLKRGVTREQFERAIGAQTVEECVHRFGVAPGDSILVRSGQLHAIDAGNLILEIQQNSDTTYRVYDWGRVGLDGKPRPLHLEESLRSIDWQDFEPVPLRGAASAAVLAVGAEFQIRRCGLAAGERMEILAGEQPRLLSVVSGALLAKRRVDAGVSADGGLRLGRGENVLVPYAGGFTFFAEGPTVVLLTENFAD